MDDKQEVFLFGPFIGDLNWEIYRFAGYAIHLKKENPDIKLIVLTRDSRFDLYGKYADILVPLNIRFDEFHKSNKFRMDNYPKESYTLIARYFLGKYNDRFKIINHFYPSIDWTYSLKWQFPRDQMDYDFKPRPKNFEIVGSFLGGIENYIVFDLEELNNVGGNIIQLQDFIEDISDETDSKESSFIGSAICLLMKSKAVLGDLNSAIVRLGMILGKPFIALNETKSDDEIHLLNPKNVPIIKCSTIEEGIEKYENYF